MKGLDEAILEIEQRLKMFKKLTPNPVEYQEGILEGLKMARRIIELIKKYGDD